MYKFIIASLLLAVSSTNYAACNSAITRTAPDSRYELLNSETEVKDKQTGLIWQRCSLGQTWSGTSCTGNASIYIWVDVLQAAKKMGGGWRVPNVKELDSIIDIACYKPSINEVFFPNLPEKIDPIGNTVYWSSSPAVDNSIDAWLVDFYFGYGIKSGKHLKGYVRLVRLGQ